MIITWSATIAGVVLVAVELGGWPYDQVSRHLIMMMMVFVTLYTDDEDDKDDLVPLHI